MMPQSVFQQFAPHENAFQQAARRGIVLKLRSSDARNAGTIRQYLRAANLHVQHMDEHSEAMAHLLLLQGVTVGHVIFPSAEFIWSRDRQPNDRAVLVIVNSGDVDLSQNSVGVHRRAGVIFVAPGDSPVTLKLTAERNEILYLGFPAALIADIPIPAGGADPEAELSLDLLRPIFQFFTTVARSSKPQNAAHTLGFIVDEMVRSLVRVMFDTPSAEQDLHTRAIEMLREELDDPSLSTAKIAERLGISVRSLQLEFQRRGTTLQAELRRLRMEAVLWARHENPERSLRSLAEAYGFRSKSALYRALAEADLSRSEADPSTAEAHPSIAEGDPSIV